MVYGGAAGSIKCGGELDKKRRGDIYTNSIKTSRLYDNRKSAAGAVGGSFPKNDSRDKAGVRVKQKNINRKNSLSTIHRGREVIHSLY